MNNEAIEMQQIAKEAKEEMLKEKVLEHTTKEYIEGLYYHRIYF